MELQPIEEFILGDGGGLVFEEEISSTIQAPELKIVAVVLDTPLAREELKKKESKTVADAKPAEAKSDIPVLAPVLHHLPERPAIVFLDRPNEGDGTNDGAVFRGGYVAASESNPAVWHAQGRALHEQMKNVHEALR